MKKDQFKPLDRHQVEIIEALTSKGSSQRDIAKITSHGRQTIRKYQKLYKERVRIAQKIQEGFDKYYGTPDIKIYTINYGLVCSIIFIVFALALVGLYFLINL